MQVNLPALMSRWGARWTDEEIAAIRRRYLELDDAALAVLRDRPMGSVTWQRTKMGLKRAPQRRDQRRYLARDLGRR
jgi:hypothetical protein